MELSPLLLPLVLSINFTLAVNLPKNVGEKKPQSLPSSKEKPGIFEKSFKRNSSPAEKYLPRTPEKEPRKQFDQETPSNPIAEKALNTLRRERDSQSQLIPRNIDNGLKSKVQLPSFKRSAISVGASPDLASKQTPPQLSNETPPKNSNILESSDSEIEQTSKKRKVDSIVIQPKAVALKPIPNSNPSAFLPTSAPGTFKEIEPIDGIDFKALHLKGELENLSMTEMKSFLKKNGLATSGKKQDLVKRIQSHFLAEE